MSDTAPPLLPPQDGDAPLGELGRDELSVFLFLAFTDDELTKLLKALRVSVPGFRVESMSGVQKADTVADELRAQPRSRAPVLAELRRIYEFPALDVVTLSPEVAGEIGLLAVEEDATVRMLWRLLADPSAPVRQTAVPVLQALAKTYYGAPGGGASQASPAESRPPPPAPPETPTAALQKAHRDAERAAKLAQKAQEKAFALQAQLKEARAQVAVQERALAQARKATEREQSAHEKAKSALVLAKGKAGRAELARVTKALARAEETCAALEARELKWRAEKAELEARAVTAPASVEAAPATPVGDEAPVEEVPVGWLRPHFTQEFYDSLEGWDLRIQRAAYKQAFLLSENHRHPSLRALPLEGLPTYYRVRVATDVRLIYRRTEASEVDLLSLIDREDLDRYVRQAKTR